MHRSTPASLRHKPVLILLAGLAVGWFQPAQAATPSAANPAQVQDAVFWHQLYANGGHTLYCNRPFPNKTSQIATDYIYPLDDIAHHLKCNNLHSCAHNPLFQLMTLDLHNMYPALKAVIHERRNALYGNVSGRHYTLAGCHFKAAHQTAEPPDAAKGNIARAIFYMHSQYGLPIPGRLDLLLQWNKADPVDAQERARNDAIDKIQGNRNPYIDHPEQAEKFLNR